MAGDLSITALYTAGTWAWLGLPAAHLFRSPDSDRVFAVTNAALWLASWFASGPDLPRSLAQRHAMIDALIAGSPRVIELAAGLSRRGAAMSADPAVSYVEVDLPGVVARKEALLAASEEGRGVLARPNLARVAADVRSVDLAALAGGPCAVVAEGLMMYLPAEEQRALWAKIARIPRVRLVFDLVPPVEKAPPGAVGRALGWLMRRFTGGQGFVEDGRSRADLLAELRACGFAEVRALEPRDLLGMPFPKARTEVVVFEASNAP